MSNPVWPMLAAERAPRSWNTFRRSLRTIGSASRRAQAGRCTTRSRTWWPARGPRRSRSGRAWSCRASRSTGSRRVGYGSCKTPRRPSWSRRLRARVGAKTLPGSAYLGEIVVHGEDIRRAVGAPLGDHPRGHLVAVADYYSKIGWARRRQEARRRVQALGDRLRVDDRIRARGRRPTRRADHGHVRPQLRGRRAQGPGRQPVGGANVTGSGTLGKLHTPSRSSRAELSRSSAVMRSSSPAIRASCRSATSVNATS